MGAEILADGGTAADAVVAMALASCVAETVMSGLLAGCHAIVFDGTSVLNLDGFAAVPSASAELAELPIAFGDELVVYAIGAPSCAVPGLPAALGELAERFGRLPWRRLCDPALELARRGVPLPEMHERTLEMLGELFARERGAEIFTRDGRTLREGELLDQAGLVQTLEALADEGAATVYRGSVAEALLQVDGVVLGAEDLASYRPVWREPLIVEYQGRRVATRGGLSGVPELLPRLPRVGELTPTERVLALVEAFDAHRTGGEHTTNMVAVDSHGRACVLTHSLGVGAGVWVPGFDTQLNNLLGESDIAFGDPQPGDHLESRMAPSLVFDANGLELAIGSAGATRLRTALATVLAAVLDEGLDAETAVGLPRFHPTVDVVDAEPGVDEAALAALEESGRAVRRWDRIHHYFGGVSCVGRAGAAGDPRRSGAAHRPLGRYFRSSLSMRRDESDKPDHAHRQQVGDVDQLERTDGTRRQGADQLDPLVQREASDDPLEHLGVHGDGIEGRREHEHRQHHELDQVEVLPRPHVGDGGDPGSSEGEADDEAGRQREDRPRGIDEPEDDDHEQVRGRVQHRAHNRPDRLPHRDVLRADRGREDRLVHLDSRSFQKTFVAS